jgi:hypothetical protein
MPSIIGTVGVFLLLLAFFLNLFKKIEQDSKLYISLNILGAGLAACYSLLIGAIPFLVLESIWAVVAISKLITILRAQKTPNPANLRRNREK